MSRNLDHLPFVQLLGITFEEIGDGAAVGSLPMREEFTSNPRTGIAHGAVPYALADTIGGAAASSVAESVTPTINMRIDYVAPPVADVLWAEAEVVSAGSNVATVDVDVTSEDDELLATARGTYKLSGASASSPWLDQEE
ncbi:MAG: PaaI family thioesterase [Natrialbaceae archaeon]|nr:PaaI family thioesterase [Natrialbaceae archaeon]